MDTIRAKQIQKSTETVQVLYQGSPVWIENVTGNNTAEITHIVNGKKEEVPVYLLIDNSPLE